jgi:putative transposase
MWEQWRNTPANSSSVPALLADQGTVCSMSRSGNVWDNAAMESSSPSMRTERTKRKPYGTRDQAKGDVFDYIERFCPASTSL